MPVRCSEGQGHAIMLPHLVQLCPIAQWVIYPSGIAFSHAVPVLVGCL